MSIPGRLPLNINTTIDYYAAMEDEHKRQAANAVNYKRKDL